MKNLLLALLLFPTLVLAGNQVYNSGLEKPMPWYIGATMTGAAGFNLVKIGTVSMSSIYPANGYRGTVGFRMTAANVAKGSGIWFKQTPGYNLPVTAGSWRTYRDWTRCTKSMRILAVYSRADGSQFAVQYPSYTVGDGAWHRIAYNLRVPVGAVKVSIGRFAYQASSCVVDNIYFGSPL